ncbi:MAG: hypothetical protein IJK42_15555 [Prevotella sp.]|nr:hypothetical protein [Prevotella sp.]
MREQRLTYRLSTVQRLWTGRPKGLDDPSKMLGQMLDAASARCGTYRCSLALAFLAAALSVSAQRRVLLLDSDTNMPIPGVSVSTDEGESVTSDGKGFATLSMPFDTVRFSHLKYSSEMLKKEEVRDTVFLIPTVHMLPEVTVSELAPEIKMRIKGWVAQAAAEGAAMAPRGIATFDFANMIDRRRRRDKKHLEKAKEVLEDWDKKK